MNNIVVRIVLAVLAAYRTSNIVTKEGGPFNVFGKLRGWLYTGYEAARLLERNKAKMWWLTLHDLFTCPYCLGVWLSFVFGALVYIYNPIADIGLLLFGIAGAQAFIQGIGDYLGGELSAN